LNTAPQQNELNQGQSSYGGVPNSASNYGSSHMSPSQAVEDLAPEALGQCHEVIIKHPDAETVFKSSLITSSMANAATQDAHGMENLYLLQKKDPNRVFQISQMPIHQQRYAVWQLNQEMNQNRQKKIKTNATEQPPPLNERGNINKERSEMSYLERKRAEERRIWGS
jgi:hypothetical protein